MVVMAHDKSPKTLDWASGDVIGRGQGLFPPVRAARMGRMTFS
jgi:hypothetical protein